ncbi:Na+/H+ antiporter subunit E [Micromonospora wenchangensis]|uniref:Na+/H+ antiporter subunit E n=1 Tax=Micromonospora wenchangensis TaxID=1185415 RepID=A0A246RHD0_9ACTN|nr:Na+/H+ antiporter subunit E [Micromonospora wenchangensis]OWV03556.1 Na+/H+ antiporter subunit E [Micromonospora wenchangensis]
MSHDPPPQRSPDRSPPPGEPSPQLPGGGPAPEHPEDRPLTRAARRRNQAVAMIVLVTVWVLLWGTLSWANVLGGLVVGLVVLTVFPLPPVTFAGRVHPVPLLRFALRFLRDLVVASVQIAALALRFGHPPLGAIIAVRLRVRSDLNLTLTAEALSLVPGSLIVEVDRDAGILYVHVLGVRDRAEVERFRTGVLELEARLIAAIGSAQEQRLIREHTPSALEGSSR